jgi:hypothetical protein
MTLHLLYDFAEFCAWSVIHLARGHVRILRLYIVLSLVPVFLGESFVLRFVFGYF